VRKAVVPSIFGSCGDDLPGLDIPRLWTYRRCPIARRDAYLAALARKINVQVAGAAEFKAIQVNGYVDDSRFELEFPAGTW
jgi:hypothetical protein